MGIVCGYALDLYCDKATTEAEILAHRYPEQFPPPKRGNWPAQYTGQTFAECKSQAVRAGWRFHKKNGEMTVTCPGCIKAAAIPIKAVRI